ncbi:MAG: ferredoxin [Actinomycetota bacterium]
MKVWIDHDLCTGDGLCEEHCGTTFQMVDGISHVRSTDGRLHPSMVAVDVDGACIDKVLDAAEDCPGECIFIDA